MPDCMRACTFLAELVDEAYATPDERAAAKAVVLTLRGAACRRFADHPAPTPGEALAARAHSTLRIMSQKPGLVKAMLKEEEAAARGR